MESEHRSAISVVFVLLLAGTMTAVAVAPAPNAETVQSANASGTATVTVDATGEATAEPDLAVVSLESAATATEPGTAADRLARNVSTLRAALVEANVSEDAIRTTDYNLFEASEPETPRPRGGANRSDATRYRAQQGIAVELSNVSRAGEVVDVAVANGATGVRGVEFTLSSEAESTLRERALENAMADARSQAETLAATEDVRITGLRAVSTTGDDVRPFVARETAVAGDAGTRIDGGPVSVSATVRVTYNATA